MSPGIPGCTLLRCGHDGPAGGDARGQDQELSHRQAGPGAGVRVAAAAPHLPGGREGPPQDPGEPVEDAGPRGRRGRGRSEGRGPRPGRRGTRGGGRPVAAARACRRRARDGPPARPAGAARPGRPAAGPGAGADHLPGRAPRFEAVHARVVGRHDARPRPRHRRTPPPTRSTRRWTRCNPGRTPSRPGSPAGTSPRPRTRRGWPCSTCRPPGWRARTARSGRAATPATGRKATSRSSTGCSPTPRAGPSRSGSSRGTPPTRPRSPRSPGSSRTTFGLTKMVMVGDRGMITTARIEALKELDGKYAWITALRAPAIRKLMTDDGPLQLSPVRRAGPRRDHQRRLPRRTAHRLPQPRPRRRARPQARGPPRRHREAARPDRRPRRRRQAHRRRRDRQEGRRGHRQVQDGQALRRHHHR